MMPMHEPRPDCSATHSLDKGRDQLGTVLLGDGTMLHSCFKPGWATMLQTEKVMKGSVCKAQRLVSGPFRKTLLAREPSGTQVNEILLVIEWAI